MFYVKDRETGEEFAVYAVDPGSGALSELLFLLFAGGRWMWQPAMDFVPIVVPD